MSAIDLRITHCKFQRRAYLTRKNLCYNSRDPQLHVSIIHPTPLRSLGGEEIALHYTVKIAPLRAHCQRAKRETVSYIFQNRASRLRRRAKEGNVVPQIARSTTSRIRKSPPLPSL